MPNQIIKKTLQDFFLHNDLPDIIEAINAANVSHIEHKENRSRREVADTVFLNQRAACFLLRLNEACRRAKALE